MKKGADIAAFLGKGTECEGRLSFQETARIDGHLKGEISSQGTLIVGEEAMIEATIHTSTIVISGEIRGDITASKRVEIHAPAKVFGNIQTPAVMVDEGAFLEGMIQTLPHKTVDEEEATGIISDDSIPGTASPPPTLYGIITDKETGNPITTATVKCSGKGKRHMETNASGFYELADLRDGVWEVKVEATGYKKAKASIEIRGEGRYEHNLELTPKKVVWKSRGDKPHHRAMIRNDPGSPV
jgi:cytoskeletal protein CcmA (bactofilin family)